MKRQEIICERRQYFCQRGESDEYYRTVTAGGIYPEFIKTTSKHEGGFEF